MSLLYFSSYILISSWCSSIKASWSTYEANSSVTKAGINWLSTIHRTITVIKVNMYVSEIFINFSGQAQYWNSLIKFVYWLTTANTGPVSYYITMTELHPCLKLYLSHWFQVGLFTKSYIYIDATLEKKERNRRKANFFSTQICLQPQ